MIFRLFPFQPGGGQGPRNRRPLFLQYLLHGSIRDLERLLWFRHRLFPPKPREDAESSNVLLALPGAMVGARGHALWPPSTLSVLCGPSPRVHLSFPFWLFRSSPHRLSSRPLSGRYPTPFFMASLLCCGPKLAACGIVLSAWGVIMLVRVLTGENRRGPNGPRCWRAGRLGDPRP